MLHFYDGQIRRYLLQTIRVLSNFTVKYGDGRLVRIPVVYGDADRQAAAIMRQNSENKINSTPRISVYINGLTMDTSRLADSTYIGKTHVRERAINEATGEYTTGQGANYTVERLMPTPFKLTMKCDIWSANTDQKLQILEQILVLFNPTLELQTTDNYIDWTSLTTLEIKDLIWSSRNVPVGADTPIDIATITFETPIWLNPPVKIKQMGVITQIITSMQTGITPPEATYIDGLGTDPIADGAREGITTIAIAYANVSGYGVQVYNGQARLLGKGEPITDRDDPLSIRMKIGPEVNWNAIFDQYPGQYKAGYTQIFLKQPNGNEVIGSVALHPDDNTLLIVNWDSDTYPSDSDLNASGPRSASPGTFDAIINPLTFNPKRPNKEGSDQVVTAGRRYLIIENIGDLDNEDGPDGWKSTSGVDFVAKENDIVEWTGSAWSVIFNAAQSADTLIYQTNIYTGVQYKWDGLAWTKSFEGEYREGGWRLRL